MNASQHVSYDNRKPVHQLGQYSAWRLRSAMRHPVDLVWISIAQADAPAAHRLLPHGEPSIAIRRRRDRDGDICSIDLTVCGPYRKPFWYRPEAREELIAVRLKPEIAASAFGVSPVDFDDGPPATAPASLRRICAYALHLAESGGAHLVAKALTEDLLHYSAAAFFTNAPEQTAAALMRKMEGRISCRTLAERLEISERHLRRRFRDHVGCSPKNYARQLRLTAASQAAEKCNRPAWAAIAAETGFHDQAHMINEFQALLGLTPHQLHAERRALSAFSNTD